MSGNVIKSSDEDRFLLCVVYSGRLPKKGVDGHIDLAPDDVLEKAAWSYLVKGAQTGMWHEDGHDGEAVCVESYIHRAPDWDVNGDGSLIVQKGDWLAGFVLSDAAWRLYKAGRIGGVSFQGSCDRKPAGAKAIARAKERNLN